MKNGRAEKVSDGIIQLNTFCPPFHMEDKNMSNRLFFNAREWNFNKSCDKNVGEKCFINGIEGKLVEVYTIGNWQWDWTEIISKPMMLEKNTEYSFCFWLNGGENDRNCEVCQLRIVFDGDHNDCMIFKLNRGYINPIKRYKGWELYDITFSTADNDLTQLKFVAQSAYMAVQPAKVPEAYAELVDIKDEYEDMRPQRHNIIFEDGWPTNNWYSTKELRKKKAAEAGNRMQQPGLFFEYGKGFKEVPFGNRSRDNFNFSNMSDVVSKRVQADMMDDLNMKDIVEQIKDEIDVDDLIEQIKDEIDIDDIKDDIKNSINMDSLRNIIKNEVLKHIS